MFFNTTIITDKMKKVNVNRRSRTGARRRRRLGVSDVRYMRKRPFSAIGQFGVNGAPLKRRRFVGRRRPPVRRVRRAAGGSRSGQLTFVKKRLGKIRPVSAPTVLKLLGNSQFWRWQSLKLMNANTGMPGKQILQCYKDTTVGNSQVPFHIYNLTAYRSSATPSSDASVGYFLQFTDAGLPVFSTLSGQDPSGSDVASQPWFWEAGDTINKEIGVKYVKTEWFSINLLLYGCVKQPTYYDIMLVRFDRQYLDPIEGSSVVNANEIMYRKAFYQNLVRNLVTNPINMGAADGAMYGMRVIRRYRTVIQPSTTIDQDTNPESRKFQIFFKDGKMRNHDYGGEPLTTDNALFDTGYAVESTLGASFQNNPKSRARLYLIVRASNTTSILPANVTANDTPSYDICMRKKVWVTNQGR